MSVRLGLLEGDFNRGIGFTDLDVRLCADELHQRCSIGDGKHTADMNVGELGLAQNEWPRAVAVELVHHGGEGCRFEYEFAGDPGGGGFHISMRCADRTCSGRRLFARTEYYTECL